MNSIKEIHQRAIASAKQANEAKQRGEANLYSTTMRTAFELEKMAALHLTNEFDSEPTRSVLFRSAVSMAISIEEYSAAADLICKALMGNPFEETKDELLNLLHVLTAAAQVKYPAINTASCFNTAYTCTQPEILVINNNKTTIYQQGSGSLYEDEVYPGSLSLKKFSSLLNEQEHFRKSFSIEMCSLFMRSMLIQNAVTNYTVLILPLLEKSIAKADTRSVWFSSGYFFSVYKSLHVLNASGIRIYFGQYEDHHPEYARQAALLFIATRLTDTGGLHEDIIPEGSTDEYAFEHILEKEIFAADYPGKDVFNLRVLRYSNNHYPVICGINGEADTTSIWYARTFIENMLKVLVYFNANGVRLYFGSVSSGSSTNKTGLFFVMTQQQDGMTVDVRIEETKTLKNISADFFTPHTLHDSLYYPTIPELGYIQHNTGKKFPLR